jgi:hypothetical protein
LLLILIPWSTFWEHNYFADAIPGLDALLGNRFVRGAVSGLGLVNVLAGLGELVDLLWARRAAEREQLPDDPARLGDHHAP